MLFGSLVEDCVVAANTWAVLEVHFTGLALETVACAINTSAEPDGVCLHEVLLTSGGHLVVSTR